MRFEEIEELERSKPLLSFKKRFKPTEESVEEFIKNLVLDYVVNLYTYEDSKVQCNPNKNRSFGDLYRIVLTYFPNVSAQKVYTELYILGINKEIEIIICGNINKRVFCIPHDYYVQLDTTWGLDEYGNVGFTLLTELGLLETFNEHKRATAAGSK